MFTTVHWENPQYHYYGSLAPRSPLRPAVVLQAEKEAQKLAQEERDDKPQKANSWAACMARIF
ncbi:MAG: hypothetical protein NTY45_12365 [Elusimicrobia bacterium]|nr:hypothetical protein [Elusimicrobiota bacterium]